MSEIHYTNTVAAAQDNLDEANRQLERAIADEKAGAIDSDRLAKLRELRDLAAADLTRVVKEN